MSMSEHEGNLQELRTALAFALSRDDVGQWREFSDQRAKKAALQADRLRVQIADLTSVANLKKVGQPHLDWPEKLPFFDDMDRRLSECWPPPANDQKWLDAIGLAKCINRILKNVNRLGENGRTWLDHVGTLIPRYVETHSEGIAPSVSRVLGSTDHPNTKAALVLETRDLDGRIHLHRGQGAPIEQRIAIYALCCVGVLDRRGLVRTNLSAREWMNLIWPNGWRPSRHWPILIRAFNRLHAVQIHLRDGIWRPIAVHWTPTAKNPDLDQVVRLNIDWPLKISEGPKILLKGLAEIGAQSASKFRVALAARTMLFSLGNTWFPHPKNRKHWLWKKNIELYPVVTLEDRRKFAFGLDIDGGRSRSQKRINKAWDEDSLGKVDVEVFDKDSHDKRTGDRGWRIIPAEIA